jgi:PTH1 family peptidyl-tRNA hydrolase
MTGDTARAGTPPATLAQTAAEALHVRRRPLMVVGLRNPSEKYGRTRHNAGAMAVERFAQRHRIAINLDRGKALAGRGALDGAEVVLVLPKTYMNVSGEAVGPLARKTGTPPSDVVIVYDDMDLPLGTIRLRPYGSAGGHNGMKSIIAALGTDRFPRLRVGVGRPDPSAKDAISHVLGSFRPDERDKLESVLERAADCIEVLLREGIERAMNKFN